MAEAKKERWSPFRFRLMTLVWLTLVIAIALGWWSERTRALQLKRELIKQEMVFEVFKVKQFAEIRTLRERSEKRERENQTWYQNKLLKLLPNAEQLELRPVVKHATIDPTVENLDTVKHFNSIISLTFTRGELTGNEVSRLYEMPQLELVSFGGSEVPIATLKFLARIPHIQRLRLSGCGIDDEKLAFIANNTRLRSLELSHNRAITDAGLKSIIRMRGLEELEIHATEITNAGLAHIEGMTKLKRVRIDQTKTTVAGREKLSKALPNCRITLEHVGNLRIGW
ncbi:MAG: hypothetical protein ACI9HK_001700 [Pirellulaceae bacterium]|jgi:hypothetical protein